MQNMNNNMQNDNNIIFDSRKEGLTAFFNRIYGVMSMGVLVSAAVAFIMINFFSYNLVNMINSGGMLFWLLWLIPIILVVPMQTAAMKNSPMALPLFLGYSAFFGFLVSFTLIMYTATDITAAFVAAAGMFIGLSIFGRVTKRDLSGMGKALFAGLIGIIIASIVNIFIGGTAMNMLISYIGVIIFSGFIAYDNQKIERVYNSVNGQVADGWAISMALSLYLDFLNLFLYLLRIFGSGSRR